MKAISVESQVINSLGCGAAVKSSKAARARRLRRERTAYNLCIRSRLKERMVEQDRAQSSWGAEKPSAAVNEPARRESHPSPSMHRGEAPRSGRRHMGVATSDPQYLPLTPQEQARERALAHEQQRSQSIGRQQDPRGTGPRPAHPMQTVQPGSHRNLQHSERYLTTPKPGKTIFKSRYEKQRRHTKTALIAIALLAIILVLIWYFFLR